MNNKAKIKYSSIVYVYLQFSNLSLASCHRLEFMSASERHTEIERKRERGAKQRTFDKRAINFSRKSAKKVIGTRGGAITLSLSLRLNGKQMQLYMRTMYVDAVLIALHREMRFSTCVRAMATHRRCSPSIE